jgi:hypothetical protein
VNRIRHHHQGASLGTDKLLDREPVNGSEPTHEGVQDPPPPSGRVSQTNELLNELPHEVPPKRAGTMQQAICRRFKARLKESQARTLERAGDIRLENEAAMESKLNRTEAISFQYPANYMRIQIEFIRQGLHNTLIFNVIHPHLVNPPISSPHQRATRLSYSTRDGITTTARSLISRRENGSCNQCLQKKPI